MMREKVDCTPNAIHTRDKSHAVKRVLERPFKADKYLQAVVDDFVMKEKTLVSVVHNSPEFTHIFVSVCKSHGKKAETLALAKHRMNCLPQTLGAHTHNMFAFVETAKYIISTRRFCHFVFRSAPSSTRTEHF